MDAIIALVISVIGFLFFGVDFCTLFELVNVAISLYKSWIDYTNDKTAKR